MTGQLYPGLPIGGGLAVLLLSTTFIQKSVSYGVLGGIIGVGSIYRIFAFLFPASMISFDPDSYAVRSLIIVITGSTDKLLGAFYSIASAFSVFGAEVTLITNLPVNLAYIVFPLLAAILLPLVASAIAYRLTKNRNLSIFAALLMTLAPTTIKYSIRPNPIFFSALLFSTLAFCFVSINSYNINKHVIIIYVLMIAMAFTHKIPIFIVVIITLIHVLLEFVNRFYQGGSKIEPAMLFFVSIGLLMLQWLFLTSYVKQAAVRILAALSLKLKISGVPRTAAIPYNPPLIDSVIAMGFGLLTLAVGGIVWVLLLKNRDDNLTNRLLIIVAVTVSIALPGLFIGSTGGFQRTIFFASAVLASLLVTGWQYIKMEYGIVVNHLFVGILILIIVSQPLANAATPDYRDSPRQYLTQGEVSAKIFSYEHSYQTVYMDAYYWDEVVNFKHAAQNAGPKYQSPVPNDERDGVLTRELTNGTLLNKNYQQVLLRTNVGVYRMDGGRWILTWDPINKLQQSNNYDKVYSNDHAIFFSNTNKINSS